MTSLTGLGVVVTRPQAQAESLCHAIESAGGRAIRFPALAIEPLPLSATLRAQGQQVMHADWLIFISANAVRAYLDAGFPTSGGMLNIAAVGSATAGALAEAGVRPDLVPADRFNSEALLESPAMNAVAGCRVVIARGVGGREFLAEELQQRGAEVTYLELYRRVRPVGDPRKLTDLWARGEIDLVTATSREVLQNFHEMLDEEGRRRLAATPLVVVSERMVQLAADLHLQGPCLLAESAGDSSLMRAMLHWAEHSGKV